MWLKATTVPATVPATVSNFVDRKVKELQVRYLP